MRAVAVVAAAVGPCLVAGCGGPGDARDPTRASPDVELPGIDTRDFTPRERHEFSRYARAFAAPCPTIAVSVADCVLEKRDCAPCAPAASAIAKAVREGMAPEQVGALYKERFDAASVKRIPLDGSPSEGADTPAVTVVEFADFECPFCQQLAPRLDELYQGRRSNVRFVYKFMPLSAHPHGEIAARAAIAAHVQGKFWEMHHELFAHPGRLEDTDLEAYARGIGLDMDRFRADLHAPATSARIEADRKLADDLGVKGTPTIFINGREYNTKSDLTEWVDAEIGAAPPGAAARP